MQIVCSWCGKYIRRVEPLKDETISHTICEKCYVDVREEIKEIVKVWENRHRVTNKKYT